MPWEMLYYVVISRLDSDCHPFFSDRREYLQAWVQDKAERKKLGVIVGTKLAKKVAELESQLNKIEKELFMESTRLGGILIKSLKKH